MRHVHRRERSDRREHLHLFIAHRFGLEAHRRFHGRSHQQLQQVILEHVAQNAGLVVEAPRGGRLSLPRPR